MNDDDDDDYSDDDVDAILLASIAELLNIAAQVAELQTTDAAAEDIYAICDVVAEYYQIERAVAVVEEHEDGSFTTRLEKFTGAEPDPKPGKQEPIPGSIRTLNKPKLRVVDSTPTPKAKPRKPPTLP
jgi:hypothetical protein